MAYLRGQVAAEPTDADFPQHTVERIAWKAPYPILRHHFGLPTMAASIEGIAEIAEAQVLDVVSLGIDQDAQENFYHPERQDPRRTGAGGVPVRSADDYRALYAASRRGNYPLLRSYAGTDDFLRLAEMYVDTINIAWSAVPLFWFNRMDGRGPWELEASITAHQELMAWHGARDIPVEANEPHHWGLRDASDTIFVASAYLAALNARASGVHDYIAQFMFNSPPGVAERMDLARMLAALDLINPLAGPDFRIWRQTRTGLLSYPLEPDAARAHLAASVYLQMALRPHIVHVVGYSEADHAATAQDVISSCRIARRAIANALNGQPEMAADPLIAARRAELVAEVQATLAGIRALAAPGVADPLTDAATLTAAVRRGVLDAPHLRSNPYALGRDITRPDARGAWVSVAPDDSQPITETQRLARLGLAV